MKYGVRKPNVKKSIKARTTGKVKRQVKKAVNPLYGKKGMGFVNDPKKAAYNAVYSRTTDSVTDLVIVNPIIFCKCSSYRSAEKGILRPHV